MSRGVNKIILVGNVGTDPEHRSTQGGTSVSNFRLATNERRKDGEAWKDHTEWHRIVAFGRLAEVCRDFLHKGSKIYIEGSIRTNKWTDKEGKDRYTTEIIANEMVMLDSRGENDGQQRGGGRGAQQEQPAADAPQLDDEDIPF